MADRRSTVADLAALVSVSDVAVRRQITRAGLKPDKEHRYDTAAVLTLMYEAKKRDKRNAGVMNPATGEMDDKVQNIKTMKLVYETKILKFRLDEIVGNVVPRAEHVELFRVFATAVINGMESWVQFVHHWTKDAIISNKAEEIRDQQRTRIMETLVQEETKLAQKKVSEA